MEALTPVLTAHGFLVIIRRNYCPTGAELVTTNYRTVSPVCLYFMSMNHRPPCIDQDHMTLTCGVDPGYKLCLHQQQYDVD